MIAFKTLRAAYDMASMHETLKEIVGEILESYWPTDRDLIVTRIAERDANQKTEVHTDGPPHRAIDFRISHVPFQTAERVEARINAVWAYDPVRPTMRVAIQHDAGSGNHLHVQVHANTIRRPA